MNAAAATTSQRLGNFGSSAQRFLVHNRVPISFILFAGMIVEDVVFWTKPQHGWLQEGDVQGWLALGFVVIGLAIRSWAAGTLRKGLDLTTDGPYSLCRNPLYLGSFLVMLGFCMAIGYAHDFIIVCGPVLGIYLLTITKEERRLAAKYTSRWEEYAATIPRLIPIKPSRYRRGNWSLAQWRTNREHRALIWSLLGMLALEAWRIYG
jgi:protein-S-isoprenylcysteine O-methyltransferase Ste14